MTRQAILSDIHANLVAFERVLEDCAAQQADEVVCLGDIVGYGPDAVECVDLVRSRCAWSLGGNHEAALLLDSAPGFNKIARQAIALHRRLLAPRWYQFGQASERWEWLEDLEPQCGGGNLLFTHGSVRDALTEYVEESDVADLGFGTSPKIIEIFARIPALAFCGHSHRPGVATNDFFWIKPHELEEQTYALPARGKTLVNVGSVGQPRDANPAACYVILDTARGAVEFHRVVYDVAAAQQRFRRWAELDQRSSLRLAEGL